jgi:sugar phosphate isomerase/epimerase
MRLERGGVSVESVLDEVARLGASCVQLNLHHVRDRSVPELGALSQRAESLGLELLASGDFVGSAGAGDNPSVGKARIASWLERAEALGSPILRVVSGFYRAELGHDLAAIDAERRYVVGVLSGAEARARDASISLLLENHSDFTADEYGTILDEVDSPYVRVFLDLINPVASLDDPAAVIRRLAPLAIAGHIKDYVFRSIQNEDGYHRHGFEVLYRYPGEGVADLPGLLRILEEQTADRAFHLTIEGLDNRATSTDQSSRLQRSLEYVRHISEYGSQTGVA